MNVIKREGVVRVGWSAVGEVVQSEYGSEGVALGDQ